MDTSMQLMKVGSQIVKQYYQNKQFCEISDQYRRISEQNRKILDTLQEYRTLGFVEKFHTAVTLLEEAFRSRSETVFHGNLHSANERFSEVLCMHRPEGLTDYIYKEIVVASYFGKFQYYAAFEDVPNMMKQFFACGTKYPLATMEHFGKAFPQLFINEDFFVFLEDALWEKGLVEECRFLLEKGKTEIAMRELQDRLFHVRHRALAPISSTSPVELVLAANTWRKNITDVICDLADPGYVRMIEERLMRAKKLSKEPIFCEEPEQLAAVFANGCTYKREVPNVMEKLENYMKRKISLMNYYKEGLKKLEGGN